MWLGSGVAVNCGVGCRCGSDLAFLWLLRKPAAVAPIRPVAWEPPYAKGEALKRQDKKKKKKKKKEKLQTQNSRLRLPGSQGIAGKEDSQ